MGTVQEQLAARVEVTKAVAEIYAQAQRCADLCATHAVPLPDEVARLLGLGVGKANQHGKEPLPTPRTDLQGIRSPYPLRVPGWLSFPLKDAQTTTLALVAMRRAGGGPMSLRELSNRVMDLDPTTGRENSLYAITARLTAEGWLSVEKGAYKLAKPDKAPVLGDDDRVWGPPEAFQSQEIARHRRDAIVAVLRHSGPLMRAELISVLKKCDWVHASLAESLIKLDLEALARAGLLRRSQDLGVWKWHLVAADGDEEPVKKPTQLRLATQM